MLWIHKKCQVSLDSWASRKTNRNHGKKNGTAVEEEEEGGDREDRKKRNTYSVSSPSPAVAVAAGVAAPASPSVSARRRNLHRIGDPINRLGLETGLICVPRASFGLKRGKKQTWNPQPQSTPLHPSQTTYWAANLSLRGGGGGWGGWNQLSDTVLLILLSLGHKFKIFKFKLIIIYQLNFCKLILMFIYFS